MLILAGRIVSGIYLYWHEFFQFYWTASSSNNVDIRRFFEFWHIGLGLHIIYVVIYTMINIVLIVLKRFKDKSHIMTTIGCHQAAIFFMVFISLILDLDDIRRPTSGGMFTSWIYMAAYANLFAAIMFSVFVISTALIRRFAKWGEVANLLVSFMLSVTLGGIISHVVWVIMFRYLHG